VNPAPTALDQSGVAQPAASQHGLALRLFIWIAIQLGVLILPVLQVPLSDNFPRPYEQLAVQELLVTQIALASLLAPWLLADWESSFCSIAATAPMLALAAALSANLDISIAIQWLYVAAWMLLLSLWCRMVPNAWWLAVVGVSSTVSLGGGALAYLAVEFDLSAQTTWIDVGYLGPICGVLCLGNAHGNASRFMIYLSMATLFTYLLRWVIIRRWGTVGKPK
jgi:hypothetical protein